MSFGIYYHIPFCRSRCRYCDFYVNPGNKCVSEKFINSLATALEKNWPPEQERPDTVYFGGGTPSLLAPEQVEFLIKKASPKQGAEITLEANPETVTFDILNAYKKAGVTRISFGVQTAKNESLRTLGRVHTAETAREALKWAKQVGFEHICGDIMMALPDYTNAEFDETLDLLETSGANHISAYLLKIEPNSAFGKRLPQNLPNSEQAAEFYLYGAKQLENAGFAQYEISNFAKTGHIGRHNMIYWDCGDYLGIGPAAHSCMHGKRFFYDADVTAFAEGKLEPVQDGTADAEDYLMLQLRLSKGLNLKEYAKLYGKQFSDNQQKTIAQCVRAGYAKFDGKTFALTPSGFLIQNAILGELI